MSRLVTFVCDRCHSFTKEGEKRGWITLYAALDPDKRKNTTFHLCPDCARAVIYELWENPEAVAQENKKLLDEKLKLENSN